MSQLKVVALMQGEPATSALWTLARMASAPCRLSVLSAREPTLRCEREAIGRRPASQGLAGALSGAVGSRWIAPRVEARESATLDRLFDGDYLRRWWRSAGIERVACTHFDHADAGAGLRTLGPDLAVCLSAGLLPREICSIPRLATLNIQHGPLGIRGAIVENRRDWIGATIQAIDEGKDGGAPLWRGGPQIAPGDTGARLSFRAHLEAVEALLQLIRLYAEGHIPPELPRETGESSHRGAPGARTWLRYLWSGSGARARVTLESAVRC